MRRCAAATSFKAMSRGEAVPAPLPLTYALARFRLIIVAPSRATRQRYERYAGCAVLSDAFFVMLRRRA